MGHVNRKDPGLTIGVDVGDRWSHWYALDPDGEVAEEGRVPTTRRAFQKRFEALPPSRVALEVGTHSPWLRRLLAECGHEVLVANARNLPLIFATEKKDDATDAEKLARVARLDPKLLSPIEHRGPEAQRDLAVVRSRDALVRARTLLVNHVRGIVKPLGNRVPSCSAEAFPRRAREALPEDLQPDLAPVLETIESMTQKIGRYDRRLEHWARERYPETELLRQVSGVGPVTAMAFVLKIEDPRRFSKSRKVPAYLGLVPRRDQSGDQDPQLRVTKAGDRLLRRLLVGCAQYIIGPRGPDTDLRRWGEKIAARGGKNARKRAAVAVARKLAVLLHRLWVTAQVYEPLRNSGAPKQDEPQCVTHA
jgi:transposase